MDTLSIIVAAPIPPELCRDITAEILRVEEQDISAFDVDHEVEHGDENARIRIVYERLRGDFAFEFRLWSGGAHFFTLERDFAEEFSRRSGAPCAIDTPDGNPFTWILFTPGAAAKVIEVDDNYSIIRPLS